MWIQISKCDNKLYQDGKVVKEIKLKGSIIDIEERSPGVIWLKIGEQSCLILRMKIIVDKN